MNWYKTYKTSQENWEITQNQYMDKNYTGHINSDAYDAYNNSNGLEWMKYEKYPDLIDTLNINGKSIEIRKQVEKLRYVKKDDQGEIIRDSQGLATYLSDEELEKIGRSPYGGSIGAFVDGKAIGLASDEFGTSGVWVVKDYQRLGLGKRLLAELHNLNPHLAKKPLGQMTNAGYNLARSYHKSLVQKALNDKKSVPNEVLQDYPDLSNKEVSASLKLANNYYLIGHGNNYSDVVMWIHNGMKLEVDDRGVPKNTHNKAFPQLSNTYVAKGRVDKSRKMGSIMFLPQMGASSIQTNALFKRIMVDLERQFPGFTFWMGNQIVNSNYRFIN